MAKHIEERMKVWNKNETPRCDFCGRFTIYEDLSVINEVFTRGSSIVEWYDLICPRCKERQNE